jgi:DNA-binding SARP family transcriptional activator
VTGIDSPRLQSLLAYLLLHQDTAPARSQLAYLLWPDSGDSQAHANLRSLLLRLRRLLPEADAFIHADAGHIQWRPASQFTLDVAEFERHLAAARSARQAGRAGQFEAAARQAVAAYTGDLLPTCYEDWIIPIRERLREAFISCLLHLAETAEQSHHYDIAYTDYLTITRLNPLWETAYRGVMRALAGLDRLPEALALYGQLERLLASELDVLPAEETQGLAASLKAELALKTAVPGDNIAQRPPFVGRVRERSLLLSRLNGLAAGRGELIMVVGEAGIGKTRLLEEAAQAAGWRGWPVAWGRSEEFTLPEAYAPLPQALIQALPRPRIQQLAQLVQPTWLATIAPLVPAVSEVLGANLPTPDGGTVSLAAAIGHLWRNIQTVSPHLFILDDVQWADPALWLLLDQLRPHLAQSAILLVVSGRMQALKQQKTAWSSLRRWEQAGHPIITLTGLPVAELGVLAEASGMGRLDLSQQKQLHVTSGGNPLLALSLLETGDLSRSISDPTLVSQVMRRLAGVSTAANEVLQAAAVIGYQFDYNLWQGVAGVNPVQLPALAGELEQAGLVYLTAEGYCFAHDTLRACVYTQMSPLRRQRLHLNALQALVPQKPEKPFVLLHHAEQAGDQPAIARYALRAGRQAMASFSYQAAIDYFSRALEMLPADDWSQRYTAVLGRQQAHDILAQRPAQAADVTLLADLATRLDERRQAEAAACQARYHLVMGDYEAAQATAGPGLEKARRSGDQKEQATLLHILAESQRSQGHYPAAQQLAAEARDCFRLVGSRTGEATMTDFLGGLAWRAGNYQAAVNHHAAAAEMFRGLGNLFKEAMALNNLGSAYWSLGDYPQARVTHERALAANRSLGHRRGEADNLDNLGGVAWVLGDYDTAVEFYNQALLLRRQMGDRWGIAISLANLGSAYRLQGKLEKALAYYDEALQLNREIGRRYGEAYTLHSRGLALLEVGRLVEAGEALQAAHAVRAELGEQHLLMETAGALALLHLAAEDLAQAQTTVDEMLTLAAAGGMVPAALRQWVSYVAYVVCQAQDQVETAVAHLVRAEAAMQEIAAPLSDQDAGRFFEGVPLNRQLLEAVAAHSQVIAARLVRAGTPPGRKLTAADYIEIAWTAAAPADSQIANPVQRRRHVLQRLLAEAEAQGAAPTADDLATALDVSRRTILRDVKTLASVGVTLPGSQRAGGR